MLRMDFLDRLDLYDDIVKADEIRLIKSAVAPLVADMQPFLGHKRDSSKPQLLLKCVLVNLFEIAVSKRLVDLKDRTSQGIGLFSETSSSFMPELYEIC